MSPRNVFVVVLVALLAGCSGVTLQARCDPPVTFGGSEVIVTPSEGSGAHIVAGVDVLACGLPVALSLSVETADGDVTICIEPPGFPAICETVTP